MKTSFAIIGCGKVGKALGKYLAKAGYKPIGFSSLRIESASQAAETAGVPDRSFKNPWDAARDADIVFITTPDDAIKETCRSIAAQNGFTKGSTVYHCSGALSSTELASAKGGGAAANVNAGSIHPLQSFAVEQTASTVNPFENIMMAIEGDHEAVDLAREIAKNLGAQPFSITTEGKILYHAAAVTASNYLVTLMGLAVQLMGASGVSDSEAFDILMPLINGTLANIKDSGIPAALTGPIARGDVGIVEKHVRAIRSLSNEMADYYIQNGMETIKVALAKGTLSHDAANQLRKIFTSESGI